MHADASRTPSLGKSCLVAALGHLAVALLLYLAGVLDAAWTPRPHRVMTARLVRLGPERKPELLPTLATPATQAPTKARATRRIGGRRHDPPTSLHRAHRASPSKLERTRARASTPRSRHPSSRK